MLLILFVIWVMLNQNLNIEIAVIGAVAAAAVFVFMCRFLDYSLKKEALLYRLCPYIVSYMAVLVIEIIKANIATASLILNPKIEEVTKLASFKSPVKTELGKVILANSITLTPGTITVNISENGNFVVHALDDTFFEGIEESVFVKRIRKMEEIIGK